MKTVGGLTYQYHFPTGMLASMTSTPTTMGTMMSAFFNATAMRTGSDTPDRRAARASSPS